MNDLAAAELGTVSSPESEHNSQVSIFAGAFHPASSQPGGVVLHSAHMQRAKFLIGRDREDPMEKKAHI